MIKSAVTISLVNEARGGPFVFWDDLAAACKRAAELGYDAIEVFAPGPDAVDPGELKSLLEDNTLSLAAVGTGAGMVKHGLSLTSIDADQRAFRGHGGLLQYCGKQGVRLCRPPPDGFFFSPGQTCWSQFCRNYTSSAMAGASNGYNLLLVAPLMIIRECAA